MRFVSLDLETSSIVDEAFALQAWRVLKREAYVTTWAITRRVDERLVTKGGILQVGDVFDFETTKASLRAILEMLIKLCKEEPTRVVGWNMTFDVGWLCAYGLTDLVMQIDWLDAMMLWKHLIMKPTFFGRDRFGLDVANQKFEKAYSYYKVEGVKLYHDRTPAGRSKLLRYNKDDTEATLLHTERFWPQLTQAQQTCALIEADSIRHVASANVIGQRVSLEAVERLSFALAEVGHELSRYFAPLGVTEDMIRSPDKVAKLLYTKWQLPIIKRNDPTAAELKKATAEDREPVGKPSTDKEVLFELGLDDERCVNLQLWREALNLRSKFMNALTKSTAYCGQGDVTHPQTKIYSTYSGRMTVTANQKRGGGGSGEEDNETKGSKPVGYAQHQMKRDLRFRNCIISPTADTAIYMGLEAEDYELVEFDAAGQEYRWMAIESGDPVMLGLCEPGEDPHSFMTSQIYIIDYTEFLDDLESGGDNIRKERGGQRKLGKVANLSLQYRTGKFRLRIVARVQYGLPMTEDEASNIWLTYRRSYVGVPKYWTRQINFGRQNGYAETLAGRRVRVEGDWDDGPFTYSMEQTMINFPIQGVGADQKNLALRCVSPILTKYRARFAWDLHDGLYFYVPKRHRMAFCHEVKRCLDNLPYYDAWGLKPPIPLPWDCKAGATWGTLTEVKLDA